MTKDRLAEMSHEKLVEVAWHYYQALTREWCKFFLAIVALIAAISFSLWLAPVSFDLISIENFSSVNKGIMWSGAVIIFARALVLIFTMYIILKIFSSEE